LKKTTETGERSMFTPRVLRLGVIALGCAALIISLGACSKDSGPTVVSTNIEEGATGVPVDTEVIITFSSAMEPATITTETFTLMQGSTLVSGEVTSTGDTATFTPASDLDPDTLYTATILAGVESLKSLGDYGDASKCVNNPGCDAQPLLWVAGAAVVTGTVAALSSINPLAAKSCNPAVAITALEDDFVLTFTTAANTGGTAPTVSSTSPENGATGVPIGANLAAVFSEEMNAASITSTTFTLMQGTTAISGTVTYAGVTGIFNPAAAMLPNTLYTATITTGAENLAGANLANNFSWTFTTGAAADNTAPTVISTFPASAATSVPIDGNISATFSEPMNPLTVTTTTFTLMQGTTAIPGTVTVAGITAIFDPTNTLASNTLYTATITTGAADLSDNALAANYVWSFTTGVATDTSAPTVISTFPMNGAGGVPIDGNISATFSEAMNPLSITTASFTLMQGTTAVPGTVTAAGINAIFNPVSALAANMEYTATISSRAADLAGNVLASNYVWTFNTGGSADTTSPMVSSTFPENAATNVPFGGNLSVTFSEAMNPLTVTSATVILMQGTTQISGTVTYAGVTAIFNPTAPLAPNTLYTATIRTGATDLAGNALLNNYVWTFTTGAIPDTTAPTVISTDPANDATAVPLNKKIAAIFSEPMNPLTLTTATFMLANGTTPVSGTVTYAGVTAIFTPAIVLAPSTLYTATITTGAKDLAGNALASTYVWTFTTGLAPDNTPPTVVSTFPADGVVGTPLARHLNVIFSEVMSPLTVSTATFLLRQGTTAVSGTVDQAGAVAIFTPTDSLLANTTYTGTITTGVEDLAGNTMVNNYVWTFTTGVTTDQDAIDLGSAAAFAILAGSTVTSTGNSIVTGDLGLSPGAAVSGFPPAVLNGSTFTGVASAAGQAKLDLTVAFNDAAGRSTGPISLAGDLSGLTLYPGLYANSTSVMLSAGNVTLNALGDENAVFIFQVGSTLTTGAGTQVVLSGGAKAANIYWQVGSSATLGTTSIFSGNILAQESITLATGAALEGRALTQTAAVSLDAATITVPAP
jgi:hypothetical protein